MPKKSAFMLHGSVIDKKFQSVILFKKLSVKNVTISDESIIRPLDVAIF